MGDSPLIIHKSYIMEDTFRTIATPAEGLYKDKGSKFLAFAFHVESEAEVKEHVDRIKKQYFDARHHCYAYALGPKGETFRANDDGEPSGTAGRPIHGQIMSAGLTNVLVVVVRYFGGILLGTSGLIVAYKEATRDALSQTQIKECTVDNRYRIEFDYLSMNSIMKILKEYSMVPQNQQYDMACSLEVNLRLSLCDRMEKSFADLRNPNIILTRLE